MKKLIKNILREYDTAAPPQTKAQSTNCDSYYQQGKRDAEKIAQQNLKATINRVLQSLGYNPFNSTPETTTSTQSNTGFYTGFYT